MSDPVIPGYDVTRKVTRGIVKRGIRVHRWTLSKARFVFGQKRRFDGEGQPVVITGPGHGPDAPSSWDPGGMTPGPEGAPPDPFPGDPVDPWTPEVFPTTPGTIFVPEGQPAAALGPHGGVIFPGTSQPAPAIFCPREEWLTQPYECHEFIMEFYVNENSGLSLMLCPEGTALDPATILEHSTPIAFAGAALVTATYPPSTLAQIQAAVGIVELEAVPGHVYLSIKVCEGQYYYDFWDALTGEILTQGSVAWPSGVDPSIPVVVCWDTESASAARSGVTPAAAGEGDSFQNILLETTHRSIQIYRLVSGGHIYYSAAYGGGVHFGIDPIDPSFDGVDPVAESGSMTYSSGTAFLSVGESLNFTVPDPNNEYPVTFSFGNEAPLYGETTGGTMTVTRVDGNTYSYAFSVGNDSPGHPIYYTFFNSDALDGGSAGSGGSTIPTHGGDLDLNAILTDAKHCASGLWNQIASKTIAYTFDVPNLDGGDAVMDTAQTATGHWALRIAEFADNSAWSGYQSLPTTDLASIKRFVEECFVHEFAHMAAGDALYGQDPILTTRVCGCFINKNTGKRGTISNWNTGPWADQIIEAVAETVKLHFLPSTCRVYANRTNWKLDPARSATFYSTLGLTP
jgi:hypothetical protein